MPRLWKMVDGEPYMINPRLGVLALEALNPKGKKRRRNMARSRGSRHMAWGRSFRKKNRSHRRRRRNPYPLAGAVTALGNPRRRRHHRKHNPRRRHRRHNPPSLLRGAIGLPPLMPVVYGAGGFVGTAMVQGFLDTLVPASFNSSTTMGKYAEILASIVIVTWGAKKFVSPGAAAFAAVGGGIFALQQAIHDFLPGVIPGMHAYTPLKAYTPLRPSSTMGRMGRMGRMGYPSAGGAMPQLATRWGMPQLAAQDYGFSNTATYAADGGMNIIANRFQRFA